MMNTIQKYRCTVGRLILFSYLIIFTLNIFHFHNYNLNSISAIDIENDSPKQLQTSISEFGCIIHQNFNSLHTLALPHSIPVFLCDDKKQNHLTGTINSFYCNFTFSNKHLRAPPTNFS